MKIISRVLLSTVCSVLFFANAAHAQPRYVALTENASIAYFSNTGALLATVPLRGGAKADNIVDFEVGDFLAGHAGPEILVLRKDYYCDIYPMSGAVKKETRLEYLRFAPKNDEIPMSCNVGSKDAGGSKPYLSVFTSTDGNGFISKMRFFEMPNANQRKQESTMESNLGDDDVTQCLAAATSLYGDYTSLACVFIDGSVWVRRMRLETLEMEKPVLAGKLPDNAMARRVRFVHGRLCILDAQNNVYLFAQDASGKWRQLGDVVMLKCKTGLLSVIELSR